MQQQLQVQLTQALREDLSSPILRYYLQQDAISCNPNSPQALYQLPYNQIIAEVVAEVTLSNKQITNNSRVAANLLQNGKEIFRNKKLDYFKQFLLEYDHIACALDGLTIDQRNVFQYSVVAISNLILKLSLNMSRISAIIIAKQLTVPMLNPFITAILFQKFLEKEHLKSKEANRKPQEHNHLLKQFPKITLIKISQTRNHFDRYYINKSQMLFGSEAHNIQFVQIYEREGDFPSQIFIQGSQKGDSYNMQEMFGLSSPFGMEFYLFFAEIVIPKMQAYRPDIVIYYEEMPQGSTQAAVKGLILNNISQKVQNKIYVLKEFGFSKNSRFLSGSATQSSEHGSSNIYKTKTENLLSTHDEQILRNNNMKGSSKIKELQIMESISQASIIKEIIKFRNEKINARLFKLPQPKTSEIQIELKKMRGLLFEELSYISLALLQRQNFQNTNSCFRNYTFPKQFLQKFIFWATTKLEEVSKTKTFSDQIISLEKKIYMLQGMLEMSLMADEETNKSQTDENSYYFYNFTLKKIDKLTQYNKNQVNSISVSKNDQIYFHYSKPNLIVFLVTRSSLKIYAKKQKDLHFKCIRQDRYEINPRLSAKNSTLVATNRFFYKAFGQFQDSLSEKKEFNGLKSIICCLRIDNIDDISKSQVNEWKFCQECIQGTGKVKLEAKIWGWGWALEQVGSSLVILGGGYNFAAENEQKVNKFFYIISNDSQIFKIGKINSDIVNLSQNLKSKNVVIPCVYGIPLAYCRKQLVMLNTNGYCQKLNHVKKMFLTRIRVENDVKHRQICVVAQNKMDYSSKRAEEDIANKNTILSYMVGYYNQINRWEGKSSFCDNQGNVLLVSMKEDNAADNIIVQFVSKRSTEMFEESRGYQIGFGRTKLALNGEIKGDFAKKNRL